MIPAVAGLGQRAAAALHVAPPYVVEHQGAVDEVLLGQRRLDARLLLDQPVERGVYLALGDINETDRQRQTGGCRRRRQGAVEGELRPRCDDPLNDHRLNQIAHALVDASAALQRLFEPELADHGLHRSHMAVRQTANISSRVTLVPGADVSAPAAWRCWRRCAGPCGGSTALSAAILGTAQT